MLSQVRIFFKEILYHRRIFLTGFGLVLALSALILFRFQPSHRAEAWLLLDATPVGGELVPDWTKSAPATDLEIAEKFLLSAAVLRRVAQDTGVFYDIPPEQVPAAMQAAISTRRFQGAGRAHVLQIVFEGADARQSHQVVAALSQAVLESDLERQSARTQRIARFTMNEVEQLQQRLAVLQNSERQHRATFAGSLPAVISNQVQARAQLLHQRQSLQAQILAEDLAQARAIPDRHEQREQVSLQLQRAIHEQERTRAINGATASNDQALESRIAALRAQLAQLSKPAPAESAATELLKTQLQEVDSQIEELTADISRAPAAAVQLDTIGWDRQQTQARLAKALAEMEEISTWQTALDTGLAQKWQLVEVPQLPLSPTGPRLVLQVLAAVVLAVISGVASVVLMTQLDRRVRDAMSLPDTLATEVLEIFPALPTAKRGVT